MAKLKEMWSEKGYLIAKTQNSEMRIWANFKGADPDPKKRWERQVEAMKRPCPACGQMIGEHTAEELHVCSRKQAGE